MYLFKPNYLYIYKKTHIAELLSYANKYELLYVTGRFEAELSKLKVFFDLFI